jgi:acyl carrier protein
MKREEIKEIVINVLTNIVNEKPDLRDVEISESTKLLSEGSFIDSLTLVSFIVDLETSLADEFNIDISLSDDRAMSREKSPYENISALVDYIDELAHEH